MNSDLNNNFLNIIDKEINSGHISHAYLIDENNNSDAFDLVMTFVKKILCVNLSENEKVAVSKRIDDNNYPELKIINPDGMLIKKQQILDLQKEFSMKAVEGNKRIYVIRDCEKMRPETANSMLKFLEEPESDIIAILMTNNVNNILSTILSRCQTIRLGNDVVNDSIDMIDDCVLEFVDRIESKGRRGIIDIQNFFSEKVSLKDREKLTSFFDKVIDMYYDIMKIIINEDTCKKSLYYEKIVKYASINKLDVILNKINYLIEARDSIKYNVNCNLLIDSIILKIGG